MILRCYKINVEAIKENKNRKSGSTSAFTFYPENNTPFFNKIGSISPTVITQGDKHRGNKHELQNRGTYRDFS